MFFWFFFWPQPQTSPRLPFLCFNNDYAKRAVLMSQHGSHYHISHTLFSGFSHARRGKEAEKVAHILVVLFSLCAVITSKGKFSSFGRSPTKRITAHNRWSTHTHTHTHTTDIKMPKNLLRGLTCAHGGVQTQSMPTKRPSPESFRPPSSSSSQV